MRRRQQRWPAVPICAGLSRARVYVYVSLYSVCVVGLLFTCDDDPINSQAHTCAELKKTVGPSQVQEPIRNQNQNSRVLLSLLATLKLNEWNMADNGRQESVTVAKKMRCSYYKDCEAIYPRVKSVNFLDYNTRAACYWPSCTSRHLTVGTVSYCA